MKLSLLQLNINADNYWEALTNFLTSHDFDVIQLQEVAGKDTVAGNVNSKIDCFVALQQILADKYNGELIAPQKYSSGPDSYLGNATFYKKEFLLKNKSVISLHKNPELFSETDKTFEKVGRELLHITLEIERKPISFLNTHFAWAKTPTEEPHQTKQGEILIEYLKTVSEPFVLSGDMNLSPDQPVIQKISSLANNLTVKNNVTNTLNPRMHRAKDLFPQGVAVDYIFVSKDIFVNKFTVITEDLSDHFGLTAEIEV